MRCGLSDRVRECLLFTPSVLHQARPDRSYTDASYLGPFRQTPSNAIQSQQSVVTLIPLLLTRCCPSAIGLFVVSIHINPVDRPSRSVRATTHIGQESFETRIPFRGHRDSTGAIVGVFGILGVKAAPLDAVPGAVLRGSAPRLAVCRESRIRARLATESRSLNSISSREEYLPAVFAGALNGTLTWHRGLASVDDWPWAVQPAPGHFDALIVPHGAPQSWKAA